MTARELGTPNDRTSGGAGFLPALERPFDPPDEIVVHTHQLHARVVAVALQIFSGTRRPTHERVLAAIVVLRQPGPSALAVRAAARHVGPRRISRDRTSLTKLDREIESPSGRSRWTNLPPDCHPIFRTRWYEVGHLAGGERGNARKTGEKWTWWEMV